jgi:hypothetical protein
MASVLLAVILCAIAFVGVVALAVDGFRQGDHSGEGLARSLRKDLEQAAAEHRRHQRESPR